MKKISMIKKILATIFLLTAVFYAYPYFGWVKAKYDYKFGEPKYYFYGSIMYDSAEFISQKLKEKNIKAVFLGCLTGGPSYEYNKYYNKVIDENLPSDFFKVNKN